MRTLTLVRQDLPLWDLATGDLDVTVHVPDLTAPLDPANAELVKLEFGAEGSHDLAVGGSGKVSMGFGAEAHTRIVVVWPSNTGDYEELLEALGHAGYFDNGAHADRLLAFFVAGAGVTGNISAKFTYSVISASAKLDAGADAGLSLVRSYAAAEPAGDLVKDLVKAIRLPAHIEEPPIEDEVVAFEYSGYLNFSGSVGFGYSMAGTESASIGGIKLSEKYTVSALGKVGVSAGVAGDFRIEVREGADANWARVQVKKNREKTFSIAADVSVGATFQSNLGEISGRDFVGALVGVNVHNWFGLIDHITKYSNLEELEKNLDTLAKSFIEEWTGKAFDQLDDTAIADLLAEAAEISAAYKNLDKKAIELFDQYFGKIEDVLIGQLEAVLGLADWDELKGDLDPELITVIEKLTDGDPLAWILGQVEIGGQPASLDLLKERAQSVLDLIQSGAHDKIREIITLVKEKFDLDELFELVDTIQLDNLEQLSNKKLTGFAERLIGQAIGEIKEHAKLVEAFNEVHKVVAAVGSFPDTLKEKIEGALNQKWSLALHAEYNRKDVRGVLVDFEVDLSTEKGRALMSSAGRGNLAGVLGAVTEPHVRVHDGLLTRRIERGSAVAFNIVGWHFGYSYESMAKVIVDSAQRIQRQESGLINVFTTAELQFEEEQKSSFRGNSERVYSNFMLALAGQSSGLVKYDKETEGYLIDIITGMRATYDLVLEDTETTPAELNDYLSLGQELGLLANVPSTAAGVSRLLPVADDGSFGETSFEYHVRFRPEALKLIFSQDWSAALLKAILRRHVLNSYLRASPLHTEVGWAYSTPGVETKFRKEANKYTNASSSAKEWTISSGNNPPKPATVTLDARQHNWLNTLYQVEDSMIAAITDLSALVRQGEEITPAELDVRLLDFGQAMKSLSRFDASPTSAFAVVDGMIGALKDVPGALPAVPDGSTNRSRLTIKSTAMVEGEEKSTQKELFA